VSFLYIFLSQKFGNSSVICFFATFFSPFLTFPPRGFPFSFLKKTLLAFYFKVFALAHP